MPSLLLIKVLNTNFITQFIYLKPGLNNVLELFLFQIMILESPAS